MLYKLTDKDGKTRAGKHNECQWGEGITHKAKGRGKKLCTDGVIHAYTHPLLAVFMDPIHDGYGDTARLWEAEGEVVADDGTKVGCKALTTICEIPLPAVTTQQRARFGTLAAKTVCTDPAWNAWADAWLDGWVASMAVSAAQAGVAAAWAAACSSCPNFIAIAEEAVKGETT
jgi:hypothetical protein